MRSSQYYKPLPHLLVSKHEHDSLENRHQKMAGQTGKTQSALH